MSGQPLVLDEWVDRLFSRPLARCIVAVAAKTPVTPNGLTLLSASCGVGAGLCLAQGWGWSAALFLAGFLVLDCSDGMLARRKGMGGVAGRAIDALGDVATATSVHLGLLAWVRHAGASWPLALLLAVGSGLSLAWASLLLDRYKRRFGGSRDDVAAMTHAAGGARGLTRWLLRAFLPYARRLDAGAFPILDAAEYRRATKVPLRFFLWNGPSTHYASMALLAAFDRAASYAVLALTLGNALAILGLWLQRRAEARLRARGVAVPS